MTYTVQYYDLVLVAIFATMALGATVGFLTTVAIPTAIVGAGLLAAALIAHGLFVNGPVDGLDDLSDEVKVLD